MTKEMPVHFYRFPDAITYKYDLATACVFGVIWSYEEMSKRYCCLSQENLGKLLGYSQRSINKKVGILRKAGLINIVERKRYKNGGVVLYIVCDEQRLIELDKEVKEEQKRLLLSDETGEEDDIPTIQNNENLSLYEAGSTTTVNSNLEINTESDEGIVSHLREVHKEEDEQIIDTKKDEELLDNPLVQMAKELLNKQLGRMRIYNELKELLQKDDYDPEFILSKTKIRDMEENAERQLEEDLRDKYQKEIDIKVKLKISQYLNVYESNNELITNNIVNDRIPISGD